MTKAYEKGFMDKCAECGVDGGKILKQAQAWLGKAFDVAKWWPKYIDLLKGGAKQRKAIAQAFKSQHGVSMGKTLKNMEKTLKDGVLLTDKQPDRFDVLLKNYLAHKAPLDQLNRNVLLARLGTGGVLTAGGLYGANKILEDDKPEYPGYYPPYSSYLG